MAAFFLFANSFLIECSFSKIALMIECTFRSPFGCDSSSTNISASMDISFGSFLIDV